MKNVLLGLVIAVALAVGASQASAARHHGYHPPRHGHPPVRHYNAYRHSPHHGYHGYHGYRSYNYYRAAPRPHCGSGYGYAVPYRSYYGGGGLYLGAPGVSVGIGW